jgi:hypothetical protein
VRRFSGVYVCEVCGVEVEPRTEPGIVYAVELEMVHASRGLEQLEGRGAFFDVKYFPEESDEWAQKPVPASAYHGGG